MVGPNDIGIAFEMPNSFVGTPEITVVGPGRSVSLNHLPLTVRPYGKGIFFELEGDDTPHMFGDGPQVRVGELRLFRDKDNFIPGFLRGMRNLNGREEILVNGQILRKVDTQPELDNGSNVVYFHPAKKLYQLRFVNPGVENLDVTIVD